jgi:hypothetical protein
VTVTSYCHVHNGIREYCRHMSICIDMWEGWGGLVGTKGGTRLMIPIFGVMCIDLKASH